MALLWPIKNVFIYIADHENIMRFAKNRREKMTDEPISTEKKEKKVVVKAGGGSSENVYFMGLIGACMYYMGRATTTQQKVRGFFKALIWPVTLVYESLKFFNKE